MVVSFATQRALWGCEKCSLGEKRRQPDRRGILLLKLEELSDASGNEIADVPKSSQELFFTSLNTTGIGESPIRISRHRLFLRIKTSNRAALFAPMRVKHVHRRAL